MAERVSPQRVFLGWSGSALPAAARWLLEHAAQPTPGDLSGELVVVPGGRAKRRLVELLAELSAERGLALVPPSVVTVGGLADRLMRHASSAERGAAVADPCTALLVRAGVLRDAADRGESVVGRLFPGTLPSVDGWPGWWSLAEQVGRLADELGTMGQTPAEAAGVEAVAGDPRWAALGELDTRYHAALAAVGLVDVHTARRDAAVDAGPADDTSRGPRVVLLATSDLRPIQTRLLTARASSVTALVFAPEAEAGGFDAWGVLRPSYWAGRPLPVSEAAVIVAVEPEDQAAAVLRALERWSAAEALSPDSVTVGLGDAALSGVVERSLGLAGVPARSAGGRPASWSRPALVLEALGAFAEGRRFDRLASLLRHPDVLAYVRREAGTPAASMDGGWLGLLDRYATEHLHGEVTGRWLGDGAQRDALGAVYGVVAGLLPEGHGGARRTLAGWADPIGAVLAAVYGGVSLRRHAPEDRPVVLGLSAIGDVLEALQRLPADAAYMPETTFAQAIGFVRARLDDAPVPEPGGDAAVELVGLLELALDDASKMAVVGVNEGSVPQPVLEDPMLPRHVRSALGLTGDDHRLARETLTLSTVAGSRTAGDCVFIAGKLGTTGDPLMPSRVLLGGDDAVMARRVARFFDEDTAGVARPALLTPGEADRFLIPRPVQRPEPLDTLSATQFGDYLACPYRFYLKHVLRLRTLDDRAVELSGAAFGNLAHATLRALGDDAIRGECRPDKLYGYLSAVLDRRVKEKYGSSPRPVVRLQAEQLRYRLEAAAHAQAAHAAEGWRVAYVESAGPGRGVEHAFVVDGEPFTLTGRIDRVDRHEDGRLLVIDYKTADSAKTPEQSHRKGPKDSKQWVDLQLPLYMDLCSGLGLDGGQIEAAYFNVPRAWEQTGLAVADWDDAALDAAREARDTVVRGLRAQRFWPPNDDPPGYDDGLAGICADGAEDRRGMIRRSAVTSGAVVSGDAPSGEAADG